MNKTRTAKRFVALLLAALFGVATTLSLSACDSDDGPMESAGERIDEAAEEAEDAAEDARDELEDAVDEVQNQ